MCFKIFGKRKKNSVEPFISQNANSTPRLNYDFILVAEGEKIDDREIENPTEYDLKKALDDFVQYDGDFIALVSNDPIDNFTMIGANISAGRLTASVNRIAEAKNGKLIESTYTKTVTPDEMYGLLKDFLVGCPPDVNEGTWIYDKTLDHPYHHF